MLKLLDFLKPTQKAPPDQRRFFTSGDKFRRDERDAAILTGTYPPDGADIESVSEYRLASLMQYPHY